MNVLLSLQRTPSEEQQQATIDKKSEEEKLIQPQEIRSADTTIAIILLSLDYLGFKPYNQSNISTTFLSRSYFSIPIIGITIQRLTPLLTIYFAQIAISILYVPHLYQGTTSCGRIRTSNYEFSFAIPASISHRLDVSVSGCLASTASIRRDVR